MIHRLEIENFYSILSAQVIDLRASGHAPEDSERLAPLWPGAEQRAPKVVALFGANASGKSNVLKALSFLAWFVQYSFQSAPDGWMPYLRFESDEARELPTRLAIHFGGPQDLGNVAGPEHGPYCRYAYEVVLGGPQGNRQQVLKETLQYWPQGKGRQVRLFERDEKGAVRAGRDFGLAPIRSALERVLRPNASMISTLAQLQHPVSLGLREMAAAVMSNILTEKQDVSEPAIFQLYEAAPARVDQLNREIQILGLGVGAMRLVSGASGATARFAHEGLHQELPLQAESNGTRQFVKLFPLLQRVLETGGVAVIDEMDQALHPLVLTEIVRWFHSSTRNPRHAQLWMTGQNASLLEDLSKEEILLCEKDAGGRTTIYGLRDVQAVRRGDNYYRKYLSGVYGAVPHLG